MIKAKNQGATFGGGCFWGVEEAFRKTGGVISTAVGYMGGMMRNPSYEDVCTDKTGHVEVVHVEFDPKVIAYNELLKVFWESHDPTQINRQGPDQGSQYRSVIFFHNPEQKDAAVKSKMLLEKKLGRKVATGIVPAQVFYKAEEYHQKYLMKRGLGTCHIR